MITHRVTYFSDGVVGIEYPETGDHQVSNFEDWWNDHSALRGEHRTSLKELCISAFDRGYHKGHTRRQEVVIENRGPSDQARDTFRATVDEALLQYHQEVAK